MSPTARILKLLVSFPRTMWRDKNSFLLQCSRFYCFAQVKQICNPGLLIFRMVVEPQNSGKSAKSCEIHKNTKNTVEILSNTCLYNIFETYFSCRGYLLAVNLQIYLGTLSLKRANNVSKLPGID